jgi:hypothetical protein
MLFTLLIDLFKKRPIALLGFWALMMCSIVGMAQTQTVTTPLGSGSFTVPAGVTSITVEVWGAGGRGGSRTSNGEAGGGGGGAYSRSVLTVTPGQVINYYVGFGSLTALPGEDSWFSGNTILMAKGGNSVDTNITTGGAGGLATAGVGDVKFSGGNGANAASNATGGGGSSAGRAANGNSATSSTGAAAPTDGGNGGNGNTSGSQGAGENGLSPGGGGGGARRSNASGTEMVGGFGGNGQIRISYIALTSATGTNNQSVCITTPVTPITYSLPPSSTVTVVNLPAGLTSSHNATAGTISISGIPTASGSYTINVTTGYGISLTTSGSVTIIPNNTVSSSAPNQTRCINTPLANITHTTTGATGISNNGVAGANGLPAGVTATWAANTITISGTPTVSGTFNYSIPLTGGCGNINATGTITVNPNNTVTAPSSTPTLCINTALTNITHNTTGATGIGAAVGLPAGVTAAWAGNTITISGTPTASGTFSYSIPLTGGCGAVNATGTITVTPDNTASAPSSTPTLCINTTLTDITHTTSGATGIGTATGLPAGVTANWAGNSITISGTPTTSGTFNYSIPLTGGCGTVNATGTITVNANNTVSGPSSTPALCVNTALTNITHSTTGATGIANAGVSGANGLPAGLSASWAGNVITISGTPTQAGTFTYSIPLTGGCLPLFAEGTIVVNPATEITGQTMADQRICDGQTFSTLSVTATGTGTLSYQWFSNDKPSKLGAVPVGTNSNSFTPPSDVIGIRHYYVEVSGGCGVATSDFSRATVEPITMINTDPSTTGEVECFGDGFDPISVVATGADLTYQWYVVTTQVNSGGTAVSGATSASFTPPSTATINAPFYYYVVVTGYCGSETSGVSGEYLVTPPITTITQDPSTTPQTVCRGASFSSISVQAIGEGTVSYQWYSNTSPSNTGGTLIPGETNPTFTPPSTTVGTLYYYATGSSDCGTVPTDVSGAFTVTPLSEIQSESLSAQTICDGDSFAPLSVNAIGTGTLTYQWYSNTTASTTGGTLITGATNSSFTPPATAPGTTRYYYVIVGSDCGPNVTSTVSGAFSVNPVTTVQTQPSLSSQTVCPGAPFTPISVSATGPGTLSYQWYSNTSSSTTGGTLIPGAQSANFTPPSSATGTTYYYVVVTSSCQSVTSNVSGAFNVNQNTQINSQNTAAQTVCIGFPFNPITVTASGTGTLTYQWYSNTSNSNSGGVAISGATSSSYTPPSSTAGTTYYYVVAGSDCGPSVASAVSGAFLVNPEPVPTFTVSPGATVCEQGTSTYTTQAGKSNYIWTVSGTAGVDYIITSGGIGTANESVSIQWQSTGAKTVTVRYTEPGTGCIASVSASSTTTVEPFATVGLPSVAFPSVCISSPALTPFTRSTTGVTGIANNGVAGANGLPPGISANFDPATGVITFSGTATTTGLFTYTIPLTGNCINGLAATGTIDVTPNYVLTSVSSVSATSAGGSATITVTGNPAILTNGNYEVTYILNDGSTSTEHTSSSFGISGGRGSFSTVPLTNLTVDVFKLTIKSIRKITDACTVNLDVTDPKNATFFSVCGATFTTNGTFTVPAGIYEITIQATGAGSSGQTVVVTIPVVPGEPLGVFRGLSTGTGAARDTYVTRDSSSPSPSTSSLVYALGGGGAGPNGTVNISYSCPDANKFDCIEIIDDGAISGTTVIRFSCDDIWEIPEGLIGFSVFSIGGGGGGGMGSTGGGGGGGGFASTTVSSTSAFGIAAGNSLNIKVGQGGLGASTANVKGGNGVNSAVTATIPDPSGNIVVNLNAMGGGGGGSFNNLNGSNGASGGGGAYSSQAEDTKGLGGLGTSGQGNRGGDGGRGNQPNHARGGGGGGGAGSVGSNGDGAGVGISKSGNGGNGSTFVLAGSAYGYGAGGGGIGFNFNGNTNDPGLGGSANGVRIGGSASDNGVGNNGIIYTGSGGGAGTTGGGNGAQGVVYVTFFNFRILTVEYLHFNTSYRSDSRSGELKWATSREWENSRFEIERAVNDVKTWTKIGEVTGAGYSDAPVDYSFKDSNLPAAGGNIFYRLKQVNLSGTSEYSVTRSIQVNPLASNTNWIVYPNPTSGDPINLELVNRGTYNDEKVSVRIISATGQYDTIEGNSGTHLSTQLSDRLKNKLAGVYTLEISWGKNREYHKIILRR